MKKHLFLLTILSVIGLVVYMTYPRAAITYPKVEKKLSGIQDPVPTYYIYQPHDLGPILDTTGMPPAKAVPILMYHGVVNVFDPENTKQENFIAQMEMLKKDGYETITLQELDDFMNGKFVLPPKPIVLTFDDGRRDSYYPTDDILKKLGFKATIFVVSGKQDTNNKFFLSYDELRKMKDSGRWDIEAHGQYSHDRVVTDDQGTISRFLYARIYTPGKGLESIDDFRKRVENDYVNNINDLQSNLGVTAKYFAIPLNEYGEGLATNYPEAPAFNNAIIKKYFRMGFIQANDSNDVTHFHLGIYNYPDSDPYFMHRIEVKNMDASYLEQILDEQRPSTPSLNWTATSTQKIDSRVVDYNGEFKFDSDGLHLYPNGDSSVSTVFFGDDHWKNYSLEVTAQKAKGKTLAIIGYAKTGTTYVMTGITGTSIFLREYVDGKQMDLEPQIPIVGIDGKVNDFKLVFKDQMVTVYFNGKLIWSNVSTNIDGGRFGFKAFDNTGSGEGIISSIKVAPVP